MHGLQGLRQNHRVKGLVFKARQAVFQIHLDDVAAVFHASQPIGVVFFHAVAFDFQAQAQELQQFTVAATQVQHLGAKAHPVRDDGKVLTKLQV